MVISMLKIRRSLGRLIFNMGIAIPGKTVFLIETAPCLSLAAPILRVVVFLFLQVTCGIFQDNTRHLVTGSRDGTICITDLSNGAPVAMTTIRSPVEMIHLLSETGNLVVVTKDMQTRHLSVWKPIKVNLRVNRTQAVEPLGVDK